MAYQVNLPTVVKPSDAKEAHAIYEEIKHRKKIVVYNFLELGKLLKILRDKKLYRLLDHQTFSSFLGDPEISFSRSTAYGLIGIFECFILKHKHDPELLANISWSKLHMIKGVYEETEDPDWIYKADTLSQKDLIDEIAIYKKKELKEYVPPEEEKPTIFDVDSYDEFIREYGCVVCGEREPTPHHFPRTKGAGAPDHWKIPLCLKCHRIYQDRPIDLMIEHRDKIFGYFYDIILTIYKGVGK